MTSLEKMNWDFVDGEIGREAIAKIETYFDILLPNDYIECALVNHGGSPDRNIFEREGHGDDVLNALLSLNSQEKRYIVNVYHNVRDRLLDKIIPFADTPFGDLVCFDYRNGKENPTVVFWDHEVAYQDKEKGISYICDTFCEFLSRLRTAGK